MSRWTRTIIYSVISGMIVLITNFMTLAAEKQLQSLGDLNSVQWAILGGGALLAVLNTIKGHLEDSPLRRGKSDEQ